MSAQKKVPRVVATRSNARLFNSDVSNNRTARADFTRAEGQVSGRLYGTLTCGRCYKPTLIVLAVGDDGYRLDRVESNCKHIPEKGVASAKC